MPHVTFIHGLANKPAEDKLLEIWKRARAKGSGGLDLGSSGITSSMVYWADVLYEAPDPDVAAYESVEENTAEQVDGGGDAKIPIGVTAQERAYLTATRKHLTDETDGAIVALEAAEMTESGAAAITDEGLGAGVGPLKLERIPLPWFIKKQIMKARLRDAYLYQFNKNHEPRPGEKFEVQTEIRRRLVAALNSPEVTAPHIVVSHSMGTMVAYDCLKRVADCPAIDGLITMGSPLGVDEVQDGFKPEWSREDGYPSAKLTGEWINIYDKLDVVCAADPKLANDYRAANVKKIDDQQVSNDGAWRHSVVKYLARSETRIALRRLLKLAPR